MVLTGREKVVPCEFQKTEKIISKYWKNIIHDNIICFDEDDTYHTFLTLHLNPLNLFKQNSIRSNGYNPEKYQVNKILLTLLVITNLF